MTREALRAGEISVDSITNALLASRGDIFVAASYLGVTAREVDGYIRASDELKAFIAAIVVVKSNHDYDRISSEQFASEFEYLTRTYRVDAINVIHELAVMPFEGAAMAEVKLKAAMQLRGVHDSTPQNNNQLTILAELNKQYQDSAPRIKSVRAIQIEME